jgi:hypothetical protein
VYPLTAWNSLVPLCYLLAAEKEYLLEYYSLVREGKTNYVSSLAFMQIFGEKPQELPEFFKAYSVGPWSRSG